MIRSTLFRYAFSVVAVSLAVLVRLALNPLVGDGAIPFLTLFVTLLFVGWYSGFGPALVSLGLGAVGAWYFILPPEYSWALDPQSTAALVIYVIAGASCAFLGQHARLRAENYIAAARASEQQLTSLFNVTNVGMAQADPITRRFLRVNHAVCALTGYSEAELLTMTVDQLNHPDDREEDRALFERLAHGESAYDIEKRYVGKDGRTVWVQVTGNILRDQDERLIRAFAVIQDITGRKRAEAQRTEALARLDSLFRHAPIGIALFDFDLRFMALNDSLAALDGIAKEEHFGKALPELLPAIGPQVESFLRRVRDTAEPALGIELAGETPAAPGEDRHWTTSFFPVTDGSRVLGIGATALDVTERWRAEQALRDSERRFSTMADSTPVIIWVTDSRGNLKFVNRACREFFNTSEEQLQGPSAWQPLVHPDDLPSVVERFETAVRDRVDFVAECRVRHADGTWRWVMSHGAPHFAADGTFLGHVASSPDITLIKRTEEALRLKEAHLQLLSDTVPALISYVGPDLRYRSCNQAYTTLLGLPSGGLIGRPVRDVTGEEVWKVVGPRLEAALVGDTVEYEANVRFPAGDLHWIRSVFTPHRDGQGHVIGVITFTTDITKAKHAEQALRASEERFRVFMDHSPARAWLKDDQGRYVFANRSALNGLGRTADEVVGKSDVDLMPSAQADQQRAGDLAVLRSGVATEVTETSQEADGEHHVLAIRFPVQDAEGHQYVGGTALDVTRQKRAEQAVIESELRFRTMAEVAPVMIWVSDARGNIEFVNRAYREFLGTSEEEVHAIGWQVLVHPDDVPVYVEPAMKAVREHTPFAGECRVRRADGSWRWISTSAAVRLSSDGEFLGHVGCSPDITELKRAEQTLKLADRRKDEFLATLAHELRNPLAPIRTGLEVLRLSRDVRDELEELRPMMERQITHMMRLIDDLFDISRITAGKIRLQRQPTLLTDLVYHAVEVNRAAIEEAGLQLFVTLPHAACLLDVDPTRFVQVLSNLLHNAAKFTDRGGQIVVSAEIDEGATGPVVALTVRDTGIGIAPATLPYVFDLFTQGDSGDRASVGLGIGLALARQLIEMLGGEIEVHSEGLGHGSAFTIRMPILTDSTPARPSARQDAPAGPRTV